MSRPIPFRLIVILIINYIALSYLSVNILLPALPSLAAALHTSNSNIQLSVTALLIGYGLSQFLWAVLSDRFGHRKIILYAISVTLVGSLIAAGAEHISLFMLGRFVEGLGAGFGPVLSRMIAKKHLSKQKLHLVFICISSVAALMPTIAPFIGGHLLNSFNWQAIQYVLSGICAIILVLTMVLLKPESQTEVSEISFQQLYNDFKLTLSNRTFMAYYCSLSLVTGSLISYYIMAPYVYVQSLHVPANKYSEYLLFVGLSYLVSSNLHRQLIKHMPTKLHMLCGFILLFSVVVELCIYNYLGAITVNAIVIAGCILGAAYGFISPTSNTHAVACIKTAAAIPMAILGSGIMLVSSIIMAIMSLFSYAHLFNLTLLYSVVFILVITSYYSLLGFKLK
jgi:DHA1 family bicyclomycin/chloramphenicol resistance-like MFS transporter